MTRISKEQPVVTLINVFTVEPENQQRLLDILIKATESVISHLPGYVSANFHKSFDGRNVVNYAQWSSQEDLDAMLQHPEAQAHIRSANTIATAAPQLYRVVFTNTIMSRNDACNVPNVGSA